MANLDNNGNDTFYLAFKDAHPSWSLIGCALANGIIISFGSMFNFSLIYLTFRSKSLHGTVNYLLALCSLFELIHQLGQFVFVYTAFSGQNFIACHLAAKILFIPMIGLGAANPTMFFTGIDRLIVITFTEIHDKIKSRLYLALLTVIAVSYGCFFSVSVYQGINVKSDFLITGSYVDFFKDPTFHVLISFLLISMTQVIYLFVGLMIRIKSAALPSADSFIRRTFRALFCIIAVNVGGYFICLLYFFLIKPSIGSPITAWFGHAIAGIPLNIGAASNGPILYFTSTEYRQAYQKVFPALFARISNTNRVGPQQQHGHISSTNRHF